MTVQQKKKKKSYAGYPLKQHNIKKKQILEGDPCFTQQTTKVRQTNNQKKQIDYWPSSRTLSPLPFLVNAGDGGLATPVVIGLIFPSVCGGDGTKFEVGAWSGAGSSMKPRQRRQPSKSIKIGRAHV